MQTDEQLRYETETGEAQVAFYTQRVEETRTRLVDAEHRYRLYHGADLMKWRSLYTAYERALENWRDARHCLYRAHVERDKINGLG